MDSARRAIERVRYASRVRGQGFGEKPGVYSRACAEEDVAEAGVVGGCGPLYDRECRRRAFRESLLETRLPLHRLPGEAVCEDEDDGARWWRCDYRERIRRDGERQFSRAGAAIPANSEQEGTGVGGAPDPTPRDVQRLPVLKVQTKLFGSGLFAISLGPVVMRPLNYLLAVRRVSVLVGSVAPKGSRSASCWCYLGLSSRGWSSTSSPSCCTAGA